MFVTAVYHNLDFSEALEKLVRVEKNKGEDKYVYVFMPNQDTQSELKTQKSNGSFDAML